MTHLQQIEHDPLHAFGYWEPEANSDAGFAANACSRRQSVMLGCFDLILHPVTPAFDYYRFGVVQEPVQHGAGQGAVVVEDFRPVFIGLVGRDDGRSGLIPLAEDLEEQISADFIDWQISKFIDQN